MEDSGKQNTSNLKTVGDIYITKSPPRMCKIVPHCLQRRTIKSKLVWLANSANNIHQLWSLPRTVDVALHSC